MRGSGTSGFPLGRIVVVLAALLAPLTVLPAAASAQDDPPFVNSASFSPTNVPDSGGTVTVTAHVVDDLGIDDVHADVSGEVNASVPMTYAGSDNWTGTFDVAPNPADAPLSFSVTVYATDTNGALAELFAGEGSVAETTPFDEPPLVYAPSVTPTSLPYTGGKGWLPRRGLGLPGGQDADALGFVCPRGIPLYRAP